MPSCKHPAPNQRQPMDPKAKAQLVGCLGLLAAWVSGIVVGLSIKYEPKQTQAVIPGTYFNQQASTDAIMAIGINALVDNVYTPEELSDILSSVDN